MYHNKYEHLNEKQLTERIQETIEQLSKAGDERELDLEIEDLTISLKLLTRPSYSIEEK